MKNGNIWKLYIPEKESNSSYATFNQYDKDEKFYYIKNSSDNLAIPRNSQYNFFWTKNGKWETLYNTLALYDAQSPNARSGNDYVQQSNTGNYAKNSNRQKNNVQYVDELYRYSSYNHIKDDLGNIIGSEKHVHSSSHVQYIYITDKGFRESLSIAQCVGCNGSGISTMSIFRDKCLLCNGVGQRIQITAFHKTIGFYTADGIFHIYEQGGGYADGGNIGGGSSTITSGGNSSSGSSLSRRTCRGCGGDGKCTACHKTGKMTSYDGTLNIYVDKNCDICHGTNQCRVCYGKGYIE